jgi:2-polyprenyl-6-methoxyphenol hydroxylase-like FAD-dependent oxidoreductase
MVWRSLARTDLPGPNAVRFMLGDRRFFGLVPIGGGLTYGFGNITCPQHQDPLTGRLSRLRQRFAGFGDPVQQYLAALDHDEEVLCSAIHVLGASVWRADRVVLVGDAAHGCSPMLAQGAAMAIEDGWVLAEVLATSEDLDSALESFVQRREPRVSWVREQSVRAAESLELPAAVRDATLRERGVATLAARFAPLRSPP